MRTSVMGTSGSGTTTAATRAAAPPGVSSVDLDAIDPRPGVVPLPVEARPDHRWVRQRSRHEVGTWLASPDGAARPAG